MALEIFNTWCSPVLLAVIAFLVNDFYQSERCSSKMFPDRLIPGQRIFPVGNTVC